MTKKYGIKNTSECVLRLPVGRSVVICNFTNGNLQSREPIPASFTTSNPIAQFAVENCDRFKNGKIFIMAEYDEAPAPAATPAPKNDKKSEKETKAPKNDKKSEKETRVMEDVKTFGDAMTVLMTESGVALGELNNVEDCIAKAAELGISFPNLKA